MNKKQIKALKALQDISERSTFYLIDWNKSKNNLKNRYQSRGQKNTPVKDKTEKIKLNLGRTITSKSSLRKSYVNILNEDDLSILQKQRQLIENQRECSRGQYYQSIEPSIKNLLPMRRISLPFIKHSKALRYAQKLDIQISHQPKIDQIKLQYLKQIKRQRFIAKLKRSQRCSQPNLHSTKIPVPIKELDSIIKNPQSAEHQQKYQKFKERSLSKYKRSKKMKSIQDTQRKQVKTLDIQLRKEEVNNDIEIMKNWLQGKKAGRKSLNALLKQHFEIQCKLKKKCKIKSLQKKQITVLQN